MNIVAIVNRKSQQLIVCCQAAIRKELNEFKSAEMEVHEASKKYTRSVYYCC